jgi:hypothetical protein
MPAVTPDLPLPVNHVFVDFENVHEIDLAVIGGKAVSFTLLVGPRQTKLDVSLVEKLFEHAVSVQLVRLTSSGKNALDFTLAYYVGRAVAAASLANTRDLSVPLPIPSAASTRSARLSCERFSASPFIEVWLSSL